jgi:hypothetical protein
LITGVLFGPKFGDRRAIDRSTRGASALLIGTPAMRGNLVSPGGRRI